MCICTCMCPIEMAFRSSSLLLVFSDIGTESPYDLLVPSMVSTGFLALTTKHTSLYFAPTTTRDYLYTCVIVYLYDHKSTNPQLWLYFCIISQVLYCHKKHESPTLGCVTYYYVSVVYPQQAFHSIFHPCS